MKDKYNLFAGNIIIFFLFAFLLAFCKSCHAEVFENWTKVPGDGELHRVASSVEGVDSYAVVYGRIYGVARTKKITNSLGIKVYSSEEDVDSDHEKRNSGSAGDCTAFLVGFLGVDSVKKTIMTKDCMLYLECVPRKTKTILATTFLNNINISIDRLSDSLRVARNLRGDSKEGNQIVDVGVFDGLTVAIEKDVSSTLSEKIIRGNSSFPASLDNVFFHIKKPSTGFDSSFYRLSDLNIIIESLEKFKKITSVSK